MDRDWVKLVAAWIATVGGYITEHMTMGRVALFATFVLTVMQGYKTWLDIILRRRQLEIEDEL